jgi:hypothetical protein
VYFLDKLIHEHCERIGTRRGTRVLGPFRHAVLVLRSFLDATGVRQFAADNHIGKTTCGKPAKQNPRPSIQVHRPPTHIEKMRTSMACIRPKTCGSGA